MKLPELSGPPVGSNENAGSSSARGEAEVQPSGGEAGNDAEALASKRLQRSCMFMVLCTGNLGGRER